MKKQDYNRLLFNQFQGFLKIPSIWIEKNSSKIPLFHLSANSTISNETFDLSVPENTLLGKRAECFFSYQLVQNPRYKILLQNIQIHKSKITQGELDYIIQDAESKKIIHVELVCKIYLLDDIPSKEIWIGPNRKDGLEQKWNKLIDKQFPLLSLDLTKEVLLGKNINYEGIKQKLCFKAMLFVHKKLFQTKLNLEINEKCIVGWWIYSNEFNQDEYQNHQYFIPQKQNWFVDPINNDSWFSHQEIKKQIANKHETKNAPLCWLKTDQNEYQKFFVVWW